MFTEPAMFEELKTSIKALIYFVFFKKKANPKVYQLCFRAFLCCVFSRAPRKVGQNP